MARPTRASQAKRKREQDNQERQQEKREKRAMRAELKKGRDQILAEGVDPDLVGIIPGPQPPSEEL